MPPSRMLALACIAALGLTPFGCDDGGDSTESGLLMTVTLVPGRIDFGTLRVGRVASAVVSIRNYRLAPITLGSATTTIGEEFTTSGFDYRGEVLIRGVDLEFSVVFEPVAEGLFSDTLVVTYDGTRSVKAPIKGRARMPDLHADAVIVGGGAFATSETIPLSYEFSEISGSGVDVGAFSVAFVLSADRAFDAAQDEVIGRMIIPSYAAGAESKGDLMSEALAPRPSWRTGSYWVGMIVDVHDDVVERREANNVVWSAATVTITFFEYHFQGTVTDAGGAPIARAAVDVAGLATKTDANGAYGPIRVDGAGPHRITVYGPPGLAGSTRTETAIGQFTSVDFKLGPPIAILVWHYPSACGGNDMTIAAGAVATNLYGSGVVEVTTDETHFWNQIAANTYDLVIVEVPVGSCMLSLGPGTPAALTALLNSGGKLIFSDPINSQSTSPFWGMMGVQSTGARDFVPTTLAFLDPNHVIASYPNAWPPVTTPWPDRNGVNVANNIVAPNGIVLATDSGLDTGVPRIVVRDDGKTLYCSIAMTDASGIDRDSDGINDGVEMWQNYITYVLAH